MKGLSENQQRLQELIKAGLNGLLCGQIDPWIEMFAEEGVMEFPYALDGYPQEVVGRAAIAEYMDGYPDRLELNSIEGPIFHFSTDPAVVIVEFSCRGKATQTGLPYNQRYIGVVTARGGKVVKYKDYWNPLVAMQAMGGAEALLAFGTKEDK